MIEININDRNQSNLPIRLKKPTNYAFLDFLSRPIGKILASFYDFHATNSELAAITGQTIYLEYILNRYFNPAVFAPDLLSPSNFNPNNDLIYIDDAPTFSENVVLFNEIEANEPTVFFNENESIGVSILFYNLLEVQSWPNFIINIPTGLQYNLKRLETMINQFKLASKQYSINNY